MEETTRNLRGLTEEQARERAERGLVNTAAAPTSKTVAQIITSNVFTLFNGVNFAVFLLVLSTGKLANTLFMGVILSNTLIGIIQEIRAKRTLDALRVLSAVQAEVIRDGRPQRIAVEHIVQDDLCVLSAGSQVGADGIVMESLELEADESLLTGESEPVRKAAGDRVLSGSYIVAGRGLARIDGVGEHSYAQQVTLEARRYKRARSQIYDTLNTIIRFVSFIIGPLGVALFLTQFFRSALPWQDAVANSAAGIIGMIPEGLILLTSIAFAVGVVKLAMRRTVVQELPGMEVLARADTLCLDKTGTLTQGTLEVTQVLPLGGISEQDAAAAAAAVVRACGDTNATAQAVEAFATAPDWHAEKAVPFSSARKASSATFTGHGVWYLGAPEFLLTDANHRVRSQAQALAEQGNRVLLLAQAAALSDGGTSAILEPQALLLLQDAIRPEARQALDFFAANGVALKILSGDNAATVAAVGRRLGLRGAEHWVDATTLGDDAEALARAAETYTVFGRVTPVQKKLLVAAMRAAGHTVAMTGDGVNDVPALREADCSIAMASGAEAAKGAAHIVLLDSDFLALPEVVAQGRQVVNNIERVACLYLVKTTFSMLLSLLTIATGWPYPFLPIHQTLIGAVSIGIPSFFLALEPNTRAITGGFMRKIIAHALPGGITVALSVFALQLLQGPLGLSDPQLRLAGVLTTGVIGLLVLLRISLPFNWLRAALFAAMSAAFFGALALFGGILELPALEGSSALAALIPCAIAWPLMALLARLFRRPAGRRRD